MNVWTQRAFMAVMLGLGLTLSAQADTRLPVSAEWSGMEQILSTMGNINASKGDAKTNQSILDILQMKEQVESQSPFNTKLLEASPKLHAAAERLPRPASSRKTF
jgi:hypothetical protein